jgi:hypothetical protein
VAREKPQNARFDHKTSQDILKELKKNQCWGKIEDSDSKIFPEWTDTDFHTPLQIINQLAKDTHVAHFRLLDCYSEPQGLSPCKHGVFHVRIHCDTGTRWRSCLRRCAISRKVMGSIPNGVVGTYHSFQPQYDPEFDSASKKMSTMNIAWRVKAAGA